jgi:hypothetical protein
MLSGICFSFSRRQPAVLSTMPPAARAQEHPAPSYFLALRPKWVERITKARREGCRIFYGALRRFGGHRMIGLS